MKMQVAVFSLFVFLLSVAVAHADILTAQNQSQCDALIAAGIMQQCTPGRTIYDSATEAQYHISQGPQSQAEFLNNNSCKNVYIACLDPEFSQRVQNFIKATQAAGQQQGFQAPHITDAWRSPGAQAAALANHATQVGPCGSAHNYGLAVDFNDESVPGYQKAIEWMRANANPYGLEHIGSWDPAHFQIQGWQNRSYPHGSCVTGCTAPPSGNVMSCTGGGAGGIAGAIQSAGNAMSSMLQPLFNLFSQPPAPPPPPIAPPTVALPATTQPDLNTIYSTSTLNIPSSETTAPSNEFAPASFTPPQTAEQILESIAAGTSSTQRPQNVATSTLTPQQLALLRAQQNIYYAIHQASSSLATSSNLQQLKAPPYAGFTTPPEQMTTQELSIYIRTLTRIAYAINRLLELAGIVQAPPPGEGDE